MSVQSSQANLFLRQAVLMVTIVFPLFYFSNDTLSIQIMWTIPLTLSNDFCFGRKIKLWHRKMQNNSGLSNAEVYISANESQLSLPCGSIALNIQFPHQGITSILKSPERKTWQKQGPPFQILPGYSVNLFYLQLTGKGFVTWEVRSLF